MNDEILKLVKAASGGDSEAFSELAEHHGRVAASIAYGILYDKHLAADAVQEAFLKAFQKLEQLKDPEAFASWFLNIVRATSIDMLRRRKRWGSREVAMGENEADGEEVGRSTPPTPPDALLRSENAVHIRSALGKLSAEYREVILLKHQEGRSYREIARLLKTSVRAVESRLFRARQQLHKLLQAHDVYVHGQKKSEIEENKETKKQDPGKRRVDVTKAAAAKAKAAKGRLNVNKGRRSVETQKVPNQLN